MLPEIFGNLSASFKAINARMKAENFRVSLSKRALFISAETSCNHHKTSL